MSMTPVDIAKFGLLTKGTGYRLPYFTGNLGTVDQVLTAVTPGLTYTGIQWRRNGANIGGATAGTYSQVSADIVPGTVIDFTLSGIALAVGGRAQTVPYVLVALAVSSVNFDVAAGAGVVLATISNKTAGSSLSIVPNDGRLALAGDDGAGWKVVRGLSAWSAGPINYAIVETIGGATNSPKSNAFTATIGAAVLPIGAIGAMTGDSIVALALTNSSGQTLGFADVGEIFWAQHMLGKFKLNAWISDENATTNGGVTTGKLASGSIYGVSGDKSRDTNGRIGLALGFDTTLPTNIGGDQGAHHLPRSPVVMKPHFCIISTGTNNLGTSDTIIADITEAVGKLRAAGIKPMVTTIRPFGDASAGAGAKAIAFPIRNQQIRDYCTANPDVTLIDLAVAYCGDTNWHAVDGSDGGLPYISGDWTGGFLHPTSHVAPIGGKCIADALAPLFASGGNFFDGALPVAAHNVNDYTLAGTPAALTPTSYLSGNRCARLSISSNSAGSVCVASVESNGDGTNNQVLTITPAGAGTLETVSLTLAIALSTTSPVDLRGTWVQFYAPVEYSQSEFWGPMAFSVLSGGSAGNRGGFSGSTAVRTKATARNGWLISLPFLVPAAATSLNISVGAAVRSADYVANGGSGALVMKLKGGLAGYGPRIVSVADPRISGDGITSLA